MPDTEAVLYTYMELGLRGSGGPVQSGCALKLMRPVWRGIGSCYSVVPRLVGPYTQTSYEGLTGALPSAPLRATCP
jgi:hypothetical protein